MSERSTQRQAQGWSGRLRACGACGKREESAPGQLSTAAFQAVVHERLRSLERQVDEVKGRVSGLIFLLAGTVAAQLVLRLVG